MSYFRAPPYPTPPLKSAESMSYSTDRQTTCQVTSGTIKSQKEERFPKSPCRAVCGDLSGNLWMPDREELVPHVKLSSNRGDKIKQKLWEGPTWLPGHPEYISLLGTK